MNFIRRQMSLISKNIREHRSFWFVFGVGLALRILLNNAADSFDFYAFVMWAKYLTTHHIADVFKYLPDGYTPYPPLYYYLLGLLGFIISWLGLWGNKWLTYLIIRSPVLLADILVMGIVYWFTRKYISKKQAPWAAAFYFLHPVVIYNTSIWGQIDAVVTVLALGSLISFILKKPFWGIGIYIVGILTKLQILAVLPLIGFIGITSGRLKKNGSILLTWICLATLPFLPIISIYGLKWTWDYFFTIPNWYAYTSVYTYNIWAPFGFIISDNTKFFNLFPYKYVGIFLFWLVAFLILKPLFHKHKRTPIMLMFAGFLLWFDFSFFATRIHSRYLIYSFGFFAPFSVYFPDLAVGLSLLMIVNLLLPIKNPSFQMIVNFLNQKNTVILFVIFAFALFILGLKRYYQLPKNETQK